jgi:Trk-type K+ transport system membrane component
MSVKVVLLYLLVLVLGAGVGLGHNAIENGGQLVLPDAVLTALLYAILGLMVLITAHACSLWRVEAPDIDLDIE